MTVYLPRIARIALMGILTLTTYNLFMGESILFVMGFLCWAVLLSVGDRLNALA